MKVTEKAAVGVFAAVAANRVLRCAAMNALDLKLRERSLGDRGAGCPPGVREEKYCMIRNLLSVADRALSGDNISPSVRRGIFESFLKNTLLGKDRRKKQLFLERFGIAPPGFITVSPTKACNLKCEGCYAGSSSAFNEKLPFHVFDRIISEKTESWGSHFTVISGGEPLMYNDGGHDLFEIFSRHRDNFFLMYTNGTLINEKTAARMAGAGNITPAISVEGYEAETDARRGRGTYRKIMKAFENLRREGVPFGISLTATRNNAELVTDEELMRFYTEEQGALYAWLFHYMPIGRSSSLDLMVTPEQRVKMLERTRKLVRDKGYFIADFWNGGPASYGCISAGRKDGYLYIIWNGDVTPCVFVPFASDNIIDIYNKGGALDDILFSPLFKSIREWQGGYSGNGNSSDMGNLLRPCPIRDHHASMRKFVDEARAVPIDKEAELSLKDDDYYRGLVRFGENVGRLTEGIWREEYLRS